MKNKLLISAIGTLAITLAACNNGNTSTSSSSPSQITGTWVNTHLDAYLESNFSGYTFYSYAMDISSTNPNSVYLSGTNQTTESPAIINYNSITDQWQNITYNFSGYVNSIFGEQSQPYLIGNISSLGPNARVYQLKNESWTVIPGAPSGYYISDYTTMNGNVDFIAINEDNSNLLKILRLVNGTLIDDTPTPINIGNNMNTNYNLTMDSNESDNWVLTYSLNNTFQYFSKGNSSSLGNLPLSSLNGPVISQLVNGYFMYSSFESANTTNNVYLCNNNGCNQLDNLPSTALPPIMTPIFNKITIQNGQLIWASPATELNFVYSTAESNGLSQAYNCSGTSTNISCSPVGNSISPLFTGQSPTIDTVLYQYLQINNDYFGAAAGASFTPSDNTVANYYGYYNYINSQWVNQAPDFSNIVNNGNTQYMLQSSCMLNTQAPLFLSNSGYGIPIESQFLYISNSNSWKNISLTVESGNSTSYVLVGEGGLTATGNTTLSTQPLNAYGVISNSSSINANISNLYYYSLPQNCVKTFN